MSADTWGLIVTCIVCSVGATKWVVSAIKDVATALAVHTVDDAKTHKQLKDQIVSLQAWRKRGRK